MLTFWEFQDEDIIHSTNSSHDFSQFSVNLREIGSILFLVWEILRALRLSALKAKFLFFRPLCCCLLISLIIS